MRNSLTKLTLFISLLIITSLIYGQDAVVLEYSVDIALRGKKLETTTHVKIQINNQRGEKYGRFQIGYSDLHKLSGYKVFLSDLFGNEIRKVKKNEVVTSSYFERISFYNDHMVKRINIHHNVYPYVIDCEYKKISSSFTTIASWTPDWNLNIPTKQASLTLTVPNDYLFKQKSTNIAPPVQNITNDQKTLTWECQYEAIPDLDYKSSPYAELLPTVEIVPIDFNYISNGCSQSWQTLGKWIADINEDLYDLPLEEQKRLDGMALGTEDTIEIIRILYHYLQDNTHYVLVNINFGGLQSYPATYVSKNRYGDCKALSNYMKALLKYKGIESNVVIIEAGKIVTATDRDFPSLQFNHVILCVPMASDTIWLECTASYIPFNYLGTFTQNRFALLIDKDDSKLVSTPALSKDECRNINCYNATIPANGRINVTTKFQWRGDNFETLRMFDKNINQDEKERNISNLFTYKNPQIANWNISTPHRDSTYAELNAELSIASPYSTVGEFLKIELPPLDIPDFEKVKIRKHPVQFAYPIESIDTIRYNNDFSQYALNTDSIIKIESEYGSFSAEYILLNHQIVIIRKLEIPSQKIELKEYPMFYDFYQKSMKQGNYAVLKQIK